MNRHERDIRWESLKFFRDVNRAAANDPGPYMTIHVDSPRARYFDYALQVLEAYPKLVAENRELRAALDECLPGLASNAILDAQDPAAP